VACPRVKFAIKSKQITIEHNLIKYSYSYMFRPYRIIIRLKLEHIKSSVPIALWK